MMTLLREKTGFILWFVIFAFVGLIVVEWGADYSGPGQEDVGDVVGVVNGEEVGGGGAEGGEGAGVAEG